MYRSILVPLDGSLPSEQSLPYAAALARRSGAALQLAYVHTPLIVGEGAMYLGTPDVQLWEEEKNYLLGVVDRLKKSGTRQGLGPCAGGIDRRDVAGAGAGREVRPGGDDDARPRAGVAFLAGQRGRSTGASPADPPAADPHAGGSTIADCGTGSPQHTGGPGWHAGGGANPGTGW